MCKLSLIAINQMGVNISNQVEIIKLNGIPATEFNKSSLSSIQIPSEYIGEYAVKVLIDSIESSKVIPVNRTISDQLIHLASILGLH
ncbi:MAG: hypothetical protein ACK5G7_04605 [Erysipelotrichaceae bacterium]